MKKFTKVDGVFTPKTNYKKYDLATTQVRRFKILLVILLLIMVGVVVWVWR